MKKWLKAAGIRAGKTAAQSALGVIGASVVLSEVQWAIVASAAALAAVISLLTSVAGIPEVDDGESLLAITSDDTEEENDEEDTEEAVG